MISNKPIAQHIKEYLKKFIEWLKHKNLDDLLPHQLTMEYASEYKSYISVHQDARIGKSLQKTTQNYYLLALRAFLAYFIAKDMFHSLLVK